MNRINADIKYPEMDYYMNEDLCDVVFVVDGQRIPAPKQLLSLKSRVFRAMFSGKFSESEDKEIPIEDTTVEAFKTFIQHLICEQLVIEDNNDFELMAQVFRLSDKYEVIRLSNKIMDCIKPQINIENLRSLSRIAFDYNLNQLMTFIIDFIENNINEIIHRNIEELTEINDCTQNRLFDVLSSDRVKYDPRLIGLNTKWRALYVPGYITEKAYFFEDPLTVCYVKIVGSFEAFKVLIGFLYFNRLIIKDKNDLQLIKEVYEMSQRYSVNGLCDVINADLKNRISFENLKPMLSLKLNFNSFSNITDKVYEFIDSNIEELVKRDVEELISVNEKSDLDLIREICEFVKRYANYYGFVDNLMNRMAVLLKNYINFMTYETIYKIADNFNLKDLINAIKTFIEHNINQICCSDLHLLFD